MVKFITIDLLYQIIRKKMVEGANESIKQNASGFEIYNKLQTVFIEIDNSPIVNFHLYSHKLGLGFSIVSFKKFR